MYVLYVARKPHDAAPNESDCYLLQVLKGQGHYSTNMRSNIRWHGCNRISLTWLSASEDSD